MQLFPRLTGCAALLGFLANAQVGWGPKQLPLPPAIQAPRDSVYPGVINIAVDATDTMHKVYRVKERLPVQQGEHLVVLYPQWDSGSHAATGPIASLAGLVMQANGRPLAWQRDPVDVFAFHVDVPAGVKLLEIDFQYLSPVSSRGGALTMTPDLLMVPWQNLMLYPAGYYGRDLPVQASLTLPAAFHQATSLEVARSSNNSTAYKQTTIERLADSPVYAGRYFSTLRLSPPDSARVTLNLFADKPDGLQASENQLDSLKTMVIQTLQMFQLAHYTHYDLLVSLSDRLPAGGGLEHLESSEINLAADFFRHAQAHLSDMTLFPHEFVHSWNGLFRQPADLWTANLNVPMRDSLLWVYEGQTEFWALLLSARSGLLTQQDTLDLLAVEAATAEAHVGRIWKTLQDSNNDPLFDAGHSVPWKDWQRREDYYGEGVLLWLDVNSMIWQRTNGKKSLADFARSFFGKDHSRLVTETYTFEDVCRALAAVTPYPWSPFLRERLDSHSDLHLLDGLTRSGYRLVYTATPTAAYRQRELDEAVTDLSFSIGLTVDERGNVRSVAWDQASFRAGLVTGARLLTIGGAPFTPALLQAVVARSETTPVEMTFTLDGSEHSARLKYQGGLRYPKLERIAGTIDTLTPLFNK